MNRCEYTTKYKQVQVVRDGS